MQKALLAVGLLCLVLSIINTVLLFQMGGKMAELKDKIEPAAKSMEKVQPLLDELSRQKSPLPPTEPSSGPTPLPTSQPTRPNTKPPIPVPAPLPD